MWKSSYKATVNKSRSPKKSLFDCKYLSIGESIQSNAKSLKMKEPILLNPNSYDNIKEILESLKVNLGIGKGKQWCYVVMDPLLPCKPLGCKKSRVLSLGYSRPWSWSFKYESTEVADQGMKCFQRMFIFFNVYLIIEKEIEVIKFTV